MGESFLGFPNHFEVFGRYSEGGSGMTVDKHLASENSYNPNHALSSYYGYRITQEYLPRKGGIDFVMSGDFYTRTILPGATNMFDIGSSSRSYDNIYAKKFKGTADIADKLSNKVVLNVTGIATGTAKFDGSEPSVSLNLALNHNHDKNYLKLSGGLMNGFLRFNSLSGIADSNGRPIISFSNYGAIQIGKGLYDARIKGLDLYSNDDMTMEMPMGGQLSVTFKEQKMEGAILKTNVQNVYISADEKGNVSVRNSRNHGVRVTAAGFLERIARVNGQDYRYIIYDSGNYTPSTPFDPGGYVPATATCNKYWDFSERGGRQPAYMWGTNDGEEMYVYNSRRMHVQTADGIQSHWSDLTPCNDETFILRSVCDASTQRFHLVIMNTTDTSRPTYPTWADYASLSDRTHWVLGSQDKYMIGVNKEGTCFNAWWADGSSRLDNVLTLGSPNYRWKCVYSVGGVQKSSDRSLKKNIQLLPDNYLRFFMMLQPVSFVFKEDSSNETHVGFIAQDVEIAMKECGLNPDEFALLQKNIKTEVRLSEDGEPSEVPILDENGNKQYIYSLGYDEFIGIVTLAIQKLYNNYIDLKKTFNKELFNIKKRIGM